MWFTSLNSFRTSNFPSRRSVRANRAARRRARIAIEPLESRQVLSTLTVTSLADTAFPNPTAGTLRYEVNQANQDAAKGISDSIDFNFSSGSILLQQGPLEIKAGAAIDIFGSGIDLLGDGTNIFTVDTGASLYLNDVVMNDAESSLSNGGAINNAGNLTVVFCSFNHDSAPKGFGGAIYNTGTLTVFPYETMFANNSANEGGVIANGPGGTASIVNDVFTGNSALDGGALDNQGTMTVDGSFFSGNSGQEGSVLDNSGNATVTTSTLAGNTSRSASSAQGGTIANSGTLAVVSSTIANNASQYAAGGILNLKSLTLMDSIVAGNTLGVPNLGGAFDVDGAVVSSSAFNLIGQGGGLSGISNGVNHNQIGTNAVPINAKLSAPADNGGPTETMMPLSGSPAIRAGGSVTTLTGAITASQTVIPVANATAIAATSTSVNILIDGEFMEVTGVNLANNTLTVQRATAPILNEVATSHNSGASVYLSSNVDWSVGAVVDAPISASTSPRPGRSPLSS